MTLRASIAMTLAVLTFTGVARAGDLDPATVGAVEAVAYDYLDGQLAGDPQRVARALHPNLAKRAVAGSGPSSREIFPPAQNERGRADRGHRRGRVEDAA